MIEQDRIKKTIRELLNLSENDAAFEQEAENALRFARKLMLRHNIDQSDLEAERTQDEVDAAAEVEYGRKHFYSETSGIAAWERSLNQLVSRLVGTVNWYYSTGELKRTRHGAYVYLDNGKRKRAARVTFYGPVADCLEAIDLVDEWRQIIIAMARLKCGTVFRGSGRSYCEGFVNGLDDKLDTIEQEEKKEVKAIAKDRSNALMIRNSTEIMKAKKQKGRAWLKNVARVTLSGTANASTAAHDSSAYQSGKKDGTKASITRTKTKRLES
jgi:hypothetical protein